MERVGAYAIHNRANKMESQCEILVFSLEDVAENSKVNSQREMEAGTVRWNSEKKKNNRESIGRTVSKSR